MFDFYFTYHIGDVTILCFFLTQEVEERFFLVFPSSFIILGVGQSLSGYELNVSILKRYVVVPGRNQTLFRCIFRLHCRVQSAVAQYFH